MKILLAVTIAMSLLAAGPVQAAYEVGDSVDDFTLLNSQGAPVSLSDFSGQVILINFFATWCPPCNDEVPLLQQMYQIYQSQGFTILGVDLLEDGALVADWVQANGLTYPIVLAPDWETFLLFPNAGGFPYNALIDRQGVLRYSQYGINMDEIETLVQELLVEDPVATAPATIDAVKALYR